MLLFGFNGRATRNFLILLVPMHYILFIDRVNLAAAATVIQQDLGLSNLALGLAFSAFNYYLCPVSASRGLVCRPLWRAAHVDGLRPGVVADDHRDRGGDRARFAVCRASRARYGRGCDVAGGDPCGVQLDPAS